MNRRLSICLVNAEFLPHRSSGQAVYAEKIARGLADHHDVTVITAADDNRQVEEHMDGIHVRRIPVLGFDPSRWLAFGYAASRCLRAVIRGQRFDIIHFLDAHVGYATSGDFVATLHQSFNQRLKANRGIPYYSSPLNLLKRYPYYRLARILEQRALRKAAAFIAVSDSTKYEFCKNCGIPAAKIETIHNGIDTDRFRRVACDALRQRLGLTSKRVLLYVGFSTPRKGLETLAQALSYLTFSPFKLVMVGKWEPDYRETFYRHAGVHRADIIEAGYVADEELPEYYSLADVFVLPSLLEGFGFPLVEALACGTPVVSTTAGSIPEVIREHGVLVPPGDPHRLAAAIDRVLESAKQHIGPSLKARQWVCEHFSETTMVNKTLEFYDRLINARKPRS